MGIFGIILIISIALTIEIVGNSLLFGIFLFEKYGVDSMRRTTNNMLWSQLCLMAILINIFALPFGIYGHCLSEVTGNVDQIHDLNRILSYSFFFRWNWTSPCNVDHISNVLW